MNAEAPQTNAGHSPHSPKRQVAIVLGGGVAQAVFLLLAMNFLGSFFLSLFPFLNTLAYSDFLMMLGAFVIGSAWLGHQFPHYAGQRAVVAFMGAVAWDASVAGITDHSGLLSWEMSGLYIDLSFVLTGMVICGLSAALCGRSKEQIRRWIRAELDEFRESIGLPIIGDGTASSPSLPPAETRPSTVCLSPSADPRRIASSESAPVDPAAETRYVDAVPVETEAFGPLPTAGILSPPPKRPRPAPSAPAPSVPAADKIKTS